MKRKLVCCLCLVLFLASAAMATETGSDGAKGTGAEAAKETAAQGADGSADSEAKKINGISIIGNDDAPKSLFIVPWKSSEPTVETKLHRTLDQRDEPVDREVFKRELDFYRVSVGK